MGEATDRLVALAGKVHVGGHTRQTKSGKTVHVDAYWRSPGDMSDAELTDAYKHFWGPEASAAAKESGQTYTQRTNQYKSIMSEFRSRGLMTIKKGGSGQDNDPNHPSYEAKPFLKNSESAKPKSGAVEKVMSKAKPEAKPAEPEEVDEWTSDKGIGYSIMKEQHEGKTVYWWASDYGDSSVGTGVGSFPTPAEALAAAKKDAASEDQSSDAPKKGPDAVIMNPSKAPEPDGRKAMEAKSTLQLQTIANDSNLRMHDRQFAIDELKSRGEPLSLKTDNALTKTGTAKGVSPEVLKVVFAYGDYTKAVRSTAKNGDKKIAAARSKIKNLAVDYGFTLDLLDATVTDNNGNIWDLFRGLKKN